MTTFKIGDRVRVIPHGGRTDNKVGVVHAVVAHRNLDVHFDDGDGGAFAQDDLEAE